jgi:low affinity Fe/Cu permease
MKKQLQSFLERFSTKTTVWAGSTTAFCLAVFTVVLWTAGGLVYGFTDTYQLVINTSTTIITFLMVFLIQRATNKENLVIQTKLNELIKAVGPADNRLISIENLSEAELETLHERYTRLVQYVKGDNNTIMNKKEPEGATVASELNLTEASASKEQAEIDKGAPDVSEADFNSLVSKNSKPKGEPNV